ncbi:MAG: PorT family protein [bacterium]|nr:PorT family protein [bacterium]
MKKIIVILACLATSVAVSAPRIGIKAGLNFANVDKDIPDQSVNFDPEMHTGIIVGAWGELPLGALENFAVRADFLYTQKGAQYDIFNKQVKIIADEIVVSPFLIYYFPTKVVRPFLEAGPELGLTVADGYKIDDEKFESGGNWKSSNFSLNLGAGVEFSLGGNALFVEGRFNRGLTNMGNWDANAEGDLKAKTYGVQMLAGIQLF